MTVMLRKESYMKAGGYLDWYCDEDYYLWVRMFQSGAIFANTGTVLVKARVGTDMYRRRGGQEYFRSEAKLQRYMLRNNVISRTRFVVNVVERFILQVLIPDSVRGIIFRRFARSAN